MSWKHLFSRSLADNPMHFAAHSHHLWPDASFDGHIEAWTDAARLADLKWDRIMGEVWPEAQRHIAAELNLPDPSSIAFSANTHDFLIRIASAIERRPLRILTTDGEFHSFRRQAARWEEAGEAVVERLPIGAGLSTRLAERSADFDLIWVSHVMFGTGAVVEGLAALAAVARPGGPWVVVDGYHSFMAVETDLSAVADRIFYLSGGYKYAMAGEGIGFVHAPPGFAMRPVVTGWFAEFDDRDQPQGKIGYAADASRLLGATFDATGLYRFNAVRRMLDAEGLTTATISAHVAGLQHRAVEALARTTLGGMKLVNPLDGGSHARFLAYRGDEASVIHAALLRHSVVTDLRGDIIRIGFGLYHDNSDVDTLATMLNDDTVDR